MVNSKQYAHDNRVWECLVGSQLYGLSTPESDHDYTAVMIELPQTVIGLESFEHWANDTQDYKIYSLRKFARMLIKGNPTITEILFTSPEHWRLNVDYAASNICWLHRYALSQRTLKQYLGYMKNQRERLMGTRGQKDVNRPELVEKYGFDTKFAMHAVRLGMQGLELAQTGFIQHPMPSSERETCLRIRHGKVSYNEVIQLLRQLEEDLEQELEHSELPPEPNVSKINAEIIDMHFEYWKETGA